MYTARYIGEESQVYGRPPNLNKNTRLQRVRLGSSPIVYVISYHEFTGIFVSKSVLSDANAVRHLRLGHVTTWTQHAGLLVTLTMVVGIGSLRGEGETRSCSSALIINACYEVGR